MFDIREDLTRALRSIDLTTLQDDDTDERVAALCAKALTPYGHVGAVCVYPQFAPVAARQLAGSGVHIAAVANFPHPDTEPQQAIADAFQALAAGADEIDVVAPWPAFKAGRREATRGFLSDVSAAVHQAGARLKVILESGQLDLAELSALSELAIGAGADFIKTSTGKVGAGASLPAARVMLQSIAASGGHCGFKAAGGVRSAEQALSYLHLADELLGEQWVAPERFRIGASALLDALIDALEQQAA